MDDSQKEAFADLRPHEKWESIMNAADHEAVDSDSQSHTASARPLVFRTYLQQLANVELIACSAVEGDRSTGGREAALTWRQKLAQIQRAPDPVALVKTEELSPPGSPA